MPNFCDVNVNIANSYIGKSKIKISVTNFIGNLKILVISISFRSVINQYIIIKALALNKTIIKIFLDRLIGVISSEIILFTFESFPVMSKILFRIFSEFFLYSFKSFIIENRIIAKLCFLNSEIYLFGNTIFSVITCFLFACLSPVIKFISYTFRHFKQNIF